MKLINLIRTGKLKPDVSRAERLSAMVQKGTKPLDEEIAEHWQDPDIEASDEGSQDVDLEEVGEPQSGLDNALESTRDPVPLDSYDLTWYMHAFTGVVHAAHDASEGDEQRLLCGRAITVNLNVTDPDSAETKTGLMCIQCNAAIKKDALFEEEAFQP